MTIKVSFLLITYNQERYVKDSLIAALAQDFGDYELVIADDCSTDKTWEIINCVVDNYPTRNIRLVKGDRNLGIGGNLLRAFYASTGDILILAAGDDISCPNRISSHVQIYMSSPNMYACYSSFMKIDDDGVRIANDSSDLARVDSTDILSLIKNGGGVGLGATYSYRRECFTQPWLYPANIMNEDRLLPLRARLLGEIGYVEETLIYYRLSSSGVSRSITTQRLFARFKRSHLMEVRRTLISNASSLNDTSSAMLNKAVRFTKIQLLFSILLSFRITSQGFWIRKYRYIIHKAYSILCIFYR